MTQPKGTQEIVVDAWVPLGYLSYMVRVINIDRATGNGRYADVLDVLEFMKDEFGSATNSAVQCIRASEIYQEAKLKLEHQRLASPTQD